MKKISRKIFLIMICLVVQMSHLSWAITGIQENIISNEEQNFLREEVSLRKKGPFQYQMEHRSDPFAPFINQKIAPPALDTPTQNFKLVGVVVVGTERVAMVEDASGKGFYLNKGTRIGRSVVSRIEESEVQLTETYRTATGRIVTKEIKMHLKKEGDK